MGAAPYQRLRQKGMMMTPPHLCQLAQEWRGTLPAWAIGEQKIDAWRALYLRDRSGRPGLFTRNGHTIPGVDHILHELAALERHAGERLFLDGEFCVGDGPDTLASTKAWCESGWKAGGNAGTFHAFDMLPYDEWFRGGTDRPWFERKARLKELALSVASDAAHRWQWRAGSRGADEQQEPVRVVPHRELWCVDDAIEMAGEMWRAGLEGIVIKDADAGYQRNRSNAWMKVGRPWQAKLGWRRAA